jgi:hypothetical protein
VEGRRQAMNEDRSKPVEIRTGHLSHTYLQRHLYSSLLIISVMYTRVYPEVSGLRR